MQPETIRKRIWIIKRLVLMCLAALTAAVTGCQPVAAPDEAVYRTWSDEAVSFQYPDWPEYEPDDDTVFFFKSDGESIFFASKYPVPVALMKQELVKNMGAVFEDDYGYYVFDTGEKRLNAVSRIVYSDYQTYLITIAAPDQPEPSLVALLSSAKPVTRDLRLNETIGIMPIPENGDAANLPAACRLSRDLGAGIISWYFFWGGLENDWTVADCVMESLTLEGKSAAVMNIIHTNVLGKLPPEFSHFTDPGFKEAFAEFSVDFVERYRPDYYFIGGEIDIYLDAHRDEIAAFKDVYDYAYEQIKASVPGTKVGSVFAYHYSRDYDALDIVRTMTENCDIVGYTVHPHESGFSYKNVSRGLEYLSEVAGVVPDKPFGILETCWSSSPLLDSDEALQAEFVDDFFSFVETGGAEFVIWFSLYDQGDCSQAAQTHLEPAPELKTDEAYVKAFEEFMCSPGLLYTDGTPKKALSAWKRYMDR